MGDFQTFPWTFLLVFLLLPILFLGVFAWFTTSIFRRVGKNQYQQSGFDRYGLSESDTGSRYGTGYEGHRAPNEPDGRWRSFSFGPGFKTSLIVLGLFALISLIFAPRFLPGVFLFLPLFWVGGGTRTYTRRSPRGFTYGAGDKRPTRQRSNF